MSIAETFKNGTILITGCTGFLGKTLTEKLLRSCDVKNIAILIRGKNGLSASQRATNIFKNPIFDRLRTEKPDFVTKIKIIDGNIEERSLGISTNDRDWLIKNVNFVFHCAATIKFNETLQVATTINIQGTENVLALATNMNNLKGFVYVSTAYSHCPRSEIKEEFYHAPITTKELKQLIKGNGKIDNILVDWPNTYTFTKALTENMISHNENQLPISIFRPSIGCTRYEPEPGWLDNMQGLAAIITSLIVGFLRLIPMSVNKKVDIVPVDYAVNALISVMWDTVNRYQNGKEKNMKPKIYNYVSSFDSTLHWRTFIVYVYETYYQVPPLQSMWYICCIFSPNRWIINITRLFLHRIPAAFVDLSLSICGKNPKMLKLYAKSEKMTDTVEVFTTREWKFDNSNTRELWTLLSQEDHKTFWFSFEEFDWKLYLQNLVYGIRKHLLHEDLNNITEALSRHRKLYWLHQLCICFIIYIVFRVCWIFVVLLM
ncbi:fatty acyl-CoA reductase wat-like isoform X2 [Melanaphis sacchari]|uniref:fatty acyl-CoA reductase wat-like isoform X2 n=1 Tax=Melanaphis sacchari TaxID=742174 RepID=UPI000DC13681|nr:fatty acyl-CoA reductase wat-like isoform X2 [Melanaphis sacchari]